MGTDSEFTPNSTFLDNVPVFVKITQTSTAFQSAKDTRTPLSLA